MLPNTILALTWRNQLQWMHHLLEEVLHNELNVNWGKHKSNYLCHDDFLDDWWLHVSARIKLGNSNGRSTQFSYLGKGADTGEYIYLSKIKVSGKLQNIQFQIYKWNGNHVIFGVILYCFKNSDFFSLKPGLRQK